MWLGNSTGVKYMYENCAPSDDDEATNRSYIGPTFTQGNRKCRHRIVVDCHASQFGLFINGEMHVHEQAYLTESLNAPSLYRPCNCLLAVRIITE